MKPATSDTTSSIEERKALWNKLFPEFFKEDTPILDIVKTIEYHLHYSNITDNHSKIAYIESVNKFLSKRISNNEDKKFIKEYLRIKDEIIFRKISLHYQENTSYININTRIDTETFLKDFYQELKNHCLIDVSHELFCSHFIDNGIYSQKIVWLGDTKDLLLIFRQLKNYSLLVLRSWVSTVMLHFTHHSDGDFDNPDSMEVNCSSAFKRYGKNNSTCGIQVTEKLKKLHPIN